MKYHSLNVDICCALSKPAGSELFSLYCGPRERRMIEQAAEKKDSLLDSAVREFARRGLLLCVALFLIEVALFFVISSLPFFPGEQALYTSQSNQIGNEFQSAGLFATFWGI